MKWQTKSSALRALDMLPSGGDNLHYFLQRNITRSLPRPIQLIPKYAAGHRRHIEAFLSRGIELSNGLLMSFGAGWDLFENIVFYGYGINRQVVLDIKPLARIELIDGIAAYLSENPLEGGRTTTVRALGERSEGRPPAPLWDQLSRSHGCTRHHARSGQRRHDSDNQYA